MNVYSYKVASSV